MSDALQLLFAGFSLGAVYSLAALSFVIIYRATGVLNFATGGNVLLGAYITFMAATTWGLPFFAAVLVAMLCMAALNAAMEALILHRMIGQPVFAVILVTLGALTVMTNVSSVIWGQDVLPQADPWGSRVLTFATVRILAVDAWTIVFSVAALVVFFLLFRYTKLGLMMRAAALDQEAALAQGVRVRRVFMISWALAGAIGALAGVMLSAGPRGVSIELSAIALRAFPAMILGGLDSPLGAVLGGTLIGVTEVFTAAVETDYRSWTGSNFHVVMPYIVMIVVLVLRPHGFFGARRADRV